MLSVPTVEQWRGLNVENAAPDETLFA